MAYRWVTILSLAILALELVVLFVNLFSKERSQRIGFLRSFKKGKCAIIYATAIPLYCIGYIHSGRNFLTAFFDSISQILSLVTLEYDTEGIEGLMQEYWLYEFAIYLCFALVTLNALVLTLSLTHQQIWSAMEMIKATVIPGDKLFIFGNNDHNISIYKSDKKRHKAIIDDLSKKDCEKMYMNRISFVSTSNPEKQIKKLFNLAKKFNREYITVINTEDDEKNIAICQAVIKIIKSASDSEQERLFLNTKIFVFGTPEYEAIYNDIVSDGFGCVHYVNKYKKIAIDFVDKYPFSKFLDEDQVDYSTSLVNDDVDINVVFIGFGKTNQQIFLTSVANNQFLTEGEADPKSKMVKYFIFDKEKSENNKNLNHSYYRYKNECQNLNPEEYLPLPSLPAEETYHQLDVNDGRFYSIIREVTTKNKKDTNIVVIAFGSDLENIDMAQKLVEKKKEWGVERLAIFVKVRALHPNQDSLKNDGCYCIGNETEVVYNIDQIIGDRMFRMSQMRNEVYNLEYAITNNPDMVVDEECIIKNHHEANKKWYIKMSPIERESNVYCCLSLRSKLNLMGLDYCEIDQKNKDDTGISREKYLAIYAGADKPNTEKYTITANGKPIVDYTLDFPCSRRRNMAVLEHFRWNSFMISKGMIPSSREQIELEKIYDEDKKECFTNGKNYTVRRHGNLTTLDGLVTFRQIVAARDNVSEVERDVIKYDYQLLDDAYWLLQSNSYKIVKIEKR